MSEVGGGVQIGVVQALQMPQHGHPRLGLDPGDQALAAARDQQVDGTLQPGQQGPDRRPVRRVDQLHRIGGQARRRQPLDHGRMDGQRTVQTVRAAAQDGDIARADAQGGRVGRHIGPALVDDGQHARSASAPGRSPARSAGSSGRSRRPADRGRPRPRPPRRPWPRRGPASGPAGRSGPRPCRSSGPGRCRGRWPRRMSSARVAQGRRHGRQGRGPRLRRARGARRPPPPGRGAPWPSIAGVQIAHASCQHQVVAVDGHAGTLVADQGLDLAGVPAPDLLHLVGGIGGQADAQRPRRLP